MSGDYIEYLELNNAQNEIIINKIENVKEITMIVAILTLAIVMLSIIFPRG